MATDRRRYGDHPEYISLVTISRSGVSEEVLLTDAGVEITSRGKLFSAVPLIIEQNNSPLKDGVLPFIQLSLPESCRPSVEPILPREDNGTLKIEIVPRQDPDFVVSEAGHLPIIVVFK